MKNKTLFSMLLFVLIYSQTIFPCSSFLLKKNGNNYVGKNFDWIIENGLVLINKRCVSKVAFKVKNPVKWVSKYGSVTFNQYGQEFPIGGINEKGLVVEALWLQESRYPSTVDSVKEIDNTQWIQYQLDNSATVDEVKQLDQSIQISPTAPVTIHCFVADRFGNSLIFESINGKIHKYQPDVKNPPVLTNDPYDRSIMYLNQCIGFGGRFKPPEGQSSVSRFIRIASELKNDDFVDPVAESFKILKSVKVTFLTKWMICYDLNNLEIWFKTKSTNGIKTIEIDKLNFDCSRKAQYIDIKIKGKGDVSNRFTDLSDMENRKLVVESFGKTPFFKFLNETYVQGVFEYPATLECRKKEKQFIPQQP